MTSELERIKILEGKIGQVVDHIHKLTTENEKLKQQLKELRTEKKEFEEGARKIARLDEEMKKVEGERELLKGKIEAIIGQIDQARIMTERILEIEIFGQQYKIRVKGEEDEKYIGHLTSLVDQKMHEVAVKSKSADMTKIAVLAALNIADELFLSQKKLDQLNEALGHMETEIESLEGHLFADDNTYTDADKSPQ